MGTHSAALYYSLHTNCPNEIICMNQKIGFDTSCKLSWKEIICMKCQSLFSGKINPSIPSVPLKGHWQTM